LSRKKQIPNKNQTNQPNQSSQTTPTEQLTESEVWNVLDFAKSIGNMYQGIYTPDLVNQRLKDITMNPLQATSDAINSALLDPKNNEDNLQGYSEFLELNNMIYKRMIGYISLMPSFDYTFTCTNIKSPKDYKSKAYLEDLNAVYDFLDKFDVRREFKKVMKQLVRQETFYSVLRMDGEKYILQELPRKYCKLTAKSEWGYLFDFNMYLFLQPGVPIDDFPPIFKKFFKRVFGNSNTIKYNPAANLDHRTGSYVYYVQTSIADGFHAWKLSPEIATEVPYLSPLFSDIVLAPMVRQLQTNKWMISAQKIAIGLIPMLKDNKSGNIRDNFSIDANTLGKFMGLLKNAIGDSIKFGAAPFESIQALDFSTTGDNMQEEFNKNMSASSGMNSRLLFGIDKLNTVETQASIDVDEFITLQIYHEFNLFMDYYLNKITRKFKFKLKFEGTEFSANKAKRLENATSLLSFGVVLPQKIAAAMNMDVADFYRMMEEAKATGFVDKLTPIIMASQLSGKDTGGRPQATEITNDGTEASRSEGSNIGRGGSI